MPSNKKLLQAAAGSAGGDPLYVEDVFSTYLYNGNSSTNVITNGIDLAGEGGMVWGKSRDNAFSHMIIDTVRGGDKGLSPNASSAEYDNNTMITSFNSNGFTLGSYLGLNYNGDDVASWTFRKAEKFFDVVTYTGNGSNRTISHSLGSVPKFMIVKRTSSTEDWTCYHISEGATKCITLNSTGTFFTLSGAWNDTAPTDSVFSVGTHARTNTNGETYVAYLFASDAGGYGDDGSENIITCSSFTVSSGSASVTLGYEPQFVIVKAANGTGNWLMFDSMRGMGLGTNVKYLQPNTSNAEGGGTDFITPTATGFEINNLGGTQTFIYIAIRRPMKTPESGTEVFALQNPGYPLGSNGLAYTSGFPVDWALSKEVSATDDWLALSRLQGAGNRLKPNTTGAEAGGISSGTFDHMTGWYKTTSANMSWMFKRATGFFDVVAYTADSVNGRTLSHNLGVAPEMTIFKSRSANSQWYIWHSGLNPTSEEIYFNSNAKSSGGIFTATPTDASLFLSSGNINYSGFGGMIAYLFATLAGVSKVGSYTGTGNNLNVDCGFSAGARFVVIKRTDASGDWFIWDSVRGIVSGDDPYVRWNVSSAEVTNTDYIDPLSSGFTVTSSASSTVNVSSGSYIFLAIA